MRPIRGHLRGRPSRVQRDVGASGGDGILMARSGPTQDHAFGPVVAQSTGGFHEVALLLTDGSLGDASLNRLIYSDQIVSR